MEDGHVLPAEKERTRIEMLEQTLLLKSLLPDGSEWNRTIEYASSCSWRAGKNLAEKMRARQFGDWERVIVAMTGDEIIGYCTASKTDCIPNVPYTPYIGYVFVGEPHRGRRLSQAMINYAMDYLKEIGFKAVYLVSDHVNLYEKYGFRVIDQKVAPWGKEEKIYMQELT